MLKIMAQNILRTIASNIQYTEFVSVMIDECTEVRTITIIMAIAIMTVLFFKHWLCLY